MESPKARNPPKASEFSYHFHGSVIQQSGKTAYEYRGRVTGKNGEILFSGPKRKTWERAEKDTVDFAQREISTMRARASYAALPPRV